MTGSGWVRRPGRPPGFAARRLTADPVGPMFGAREPGAELAGLRELAVAELGERHAHASPDLALAGPLGRASPGPE